MLPAAKPPQGATSDWRALRIEQRLDVYPVQSDVGASLDDIIAAAAGRPLDVLEIGTGCGIIACALAAAGHRVVATDLLPAAARLALANALRNGLALPVLVGDLAAAIVARPAFDLIVFNVPNTVATTRFGNLLQHLGPLLLPRRLLEPVSALLARHGRGQRAAKARLLDRLLDELRPRLRPAGRIILLLQNADLAALQSRRHALAGLQVESRAIRGSACTRLVEIRRCPGH